MKAKAKSSAKTTPKKKKTAGGKAGDSESEIAAKDEEVVPEAIPAPKEPKQLKRPAASAGMRRPAATAPIVALKYKYHKLHKWGVRIKNGSAILTVTSLIQVVFFFEDSYPVQAKYYVCLIECKSVASIMFFSSAAFNFTR